MCYKNYDDNDYRAMSGFQQDMTRAGVFAGYEDTETGRYPSYVPIFVHNAAAPMWSASRSFAARICNDSNISKHDRANGYNSFERCVDSLAAFLGYRWNQDTDSRQRTYAPAEGMEDRKHHFVLITADGDLSFFWRWLSYDPETKQVHERPQMVGGLIFHREVSYTDGEYGPEHEFDGLRGSWSTHT